MGVLGCSECPTASIRVGTASWSEPEFIKAGWYPKGLLAQHRPSYYAQFFDYVELSFSFYAISHDLAQLVGDVHIVFNSNSRDFTPKVAERLRRRPGQVPGTLLLNQNRKIYSKTRA